MSPVVLPWKKPPTVTELADWLSVNKNKVLEFAENDELELINIASPQATQKRWRVTLESIREFLANRSSRSKESKAERRRSIKQVSRRNKADKYGNVLGD